MSGGNPSASLPATVRRSVVARPDLPPVVTADHARWARTQASDCHGRLNQQAGELFMHSLDRWMCGTVCRPEHGSVVRPTRHDVNVKVGYGLPRVRPTRVQQDNPCSAEGFRHCPRCALNQCHGRDQRRLACVKHTNAMLAWNNERVPRCKLPLGKRQERHRVIAAGNPPRLAGLHQSAEHATLRLGIRDGQPVICARSHVAGVCTPLRGDLIRRLAVMPASSGRPPPRRGRPTTPARPRAGCGSSSRVRRSGCSG